jgi:hypothetical protein
MADKVEVYVNGNDFEARMVKEMDGYDLDTILAEMIAAYEVSQRANNAWMRIASKLRNELLRIRASK